MITTCQSPIQLRSHSVVHHECQCATCAFEVLFSMLGMPTHCVSLKMTVLISHSVCHLSFVALYSSSFQLLISEQTGFSFFVIHFSYSEDICYKYLQRSAMQYIILKFSLPRTQSKELTEKTPVLLHCPTMSCSYLVLPCMSESISCLVF